MGRGRDGRNDTDSSTGDGRQEAGGAPAAYGQPAYGQNPYGQNQQGPYGRTQQEQGSWSPPYGAPVPPQQAPYAPPPPAGRGNGRPGLIVLISLLVQLVVIAAVGNTWVVRHGLEFRGDHNDTLGAFGFLPAVVSWRFTPQGSDLGNAYAAMLVGLLALVVVAALLTLALVRGPVTFWRAFVGVWLSVIAATLVNGMVRRAIFDDFGRYDATGGKIVGVFFQGGGTEVVAGALIGLLAALVAAVVAVTTRRRVLAPVPAPPPVAEPQQDPEAPPPWYGHDVRDARDATPTGGASPSMQKVQSSVGQGPVPGSTNRLPDVAPPSQRPSGESDAQATTQFKAVAPERTDEPTQASLAATPAADDNEQTTRIRRPEVPTRPDGSAEPAAPAAPPAQPDPQSTQRFPRPPDDEDMGHHPDS